MAADPRVVTLYGCPGRVATVIDDRSFSEWYADWCSRSVEHLGSATPTSTSSSILRTERTPNDVTVRLGSVYVVATHYHGRLPEPDRESFGGNSLQ